MRINLGTMVGMSRLHQQVLSLFLAVALLFAPLQGVMASVETGGDMNTMHGMTHAVAMDHAAMMDASAASDMERVAMAEADCDQCNASACCIGAQCLSGHCATCAMGLLPVVSPFSGHGARLVLMVPDSALLPLFSDALFRPPRV